MLSSIHTLGKTIIMWDSLSFSQDPVKIYAKQSLI